MLGDRVLDLCELAVEEVDRAQAAVDGLALVDRQRLLAPAAAPAVGSSPQQRRG